MHHLSVYIYILIAIPGCTAYYVYIHTYGWSDVRILSCSCVLWCDGMCGNGASQANKADIDAKQKDGFTPLHISSENGNDKIAELLVVRDEGQGRENVRICRTRGGCGGGRMSVRYTSI